jgi:hypothetical protein
VPYDDGCRRRPCVRQECDGLGGLAEVTIGQIINSCEPMGNLDNLLIDDLTEDDEDQFFGLTRPRLWPSNQSWIDHSGQYRSPASSGSSSSRSSIKV